MHHVGAGYHLEYLPGKVRAAADSGRWKRELSRIRLRVSYQLLDRSYLERGMHHDQLRDRRAKNDGAEIPFGIVGNGAEYARGHCVRAHAAHQERVAIGNRLRNDVRADDAGGAGSIVDHDLLLGEPLAELGRNHPRNDVGSAARRKGYDQADRFRRIALCPAMSGNDQSEEQEQA